MTRKGFTLIELLVVMAIISILLSIVAPRYFRSVSKAEEAVLRENLTLTREALDKYYADSGQYPTTLQDLVAKKYLRKIPFDPVAKNSSWIIVPPENPSQGSVFNIKSSAPGKGSDGSLYSEW